MATYNDYFLDLARVAESVAQGERGQINYPHNRVEMLATLVQALAQTLAGGEPAFTTAWPDLPPDPAAPAQVSGATNVLPFQAYTPPFAGGIPLIGTLTVPADGSAAGVATFAPAFPNSTLGVWTQVLNDFNANPWGLTPPQIPPSSISKTGFSVWIGGGPPSSTVTVVYLAVGN